MHRSLAVVILTGLAPLTARAEPRLEQQPDSATTVLGLDPTDVDREEIWSGKLQSLRLYLGEGAPKIGWRVGDVLYLYTVDTAERVNDAQMLFFLLGQNSLESFVADRHGPHKSFVETRVVRALRLRTPEDKAPRAASLP